MIFSYRLTLTDEPMQLPKVRPLFTQVRFSAPISNSDAVYLSGSPVDSESSSLRYGVAAGKDFPLPVTDLSQLYAYGTSGDVLDVICQIEETEYPMEVKEGKKNVKTD